MAQCLRFLCGEFKSNEGMLIDLDVEQLDIKIRTGFTRKVYLLLSTLLLVLFVFVFCFTLSTSTQYFVLKYNFIYYICLVITIILLFTLCLFSRLRHMKPYNYILVAVLTLTKSYTVATYSACFGPTEVFVSLFVSLLICTGSTIFAIKCGKDFTKWRNLTLFLFIAIIAVIILEPMVRFLLIFNIIFVAISIIIFALWLIYHTQLITARSNRKYCFSAEEYIFALIILYLEMTSIYSLVLTLFGGRLTFFFFFSSVTLRESGPKKSEANNVNN